MNIFEVEAVSGNNRHTVKVPEKTLSKITGDKQEKARDVLNDYLYGNIHTDVYDVENCFSDDAEIEYLEFDSAEEAGLSLGDKGEKGKIKALLIVISEKKGNELKMNELLEILKSLSQKTGLDFERPEMLYNVVSESPARFLRLLVQKK